MDYIGIDKVSLAGIDTVSLEDFVTTLLVDGVVGYDLICHNSYISDVTLDGKNINNYLPKEYHHADGTVHVQEPLETDLLELLAASDWKEVTIYNHYGEVFRFTIAYGLAHYTSYELFD